LPEYFGIWPWFEGPNRAARPFEAGAAHLISPTKRGRLFP